MPGGFLLRGGRGGGEGPPARGQDRHEGESRGKRALHGPRHLQADARGQALGELPEELQISWREAESRLILTAVGVQKRPLLTWTATGPHRWGNWSPTRLR